MALALLFFMATASIKGIHQSLESLQVLYWLFWYIVTLVWVARNFPKFLDMALRNLIFLSWPAIALASFFWSYDPNKTLYDGIQLTMTVLIGLLIAHHFSLSAIVWCLFYALFVVLALSALQIAAGVPSAFFPTGQWQGLFSHKNQLGGACQLFLATALALPNKRSFATFWLISIALSTILAIGAGSATQLIIFILIASFYVFSFFVNRNIGFFALIFGVGLLFLPVVVYLIASGSLDLLGVVAESFGKDRTLTGRTLLWEFGTDAFLQRPWLGYGYKAYWTCCETSAVTIWALTRSFLISFHNNFIEIAVAFGVIGLTLLVLGLMTASYRALQYWLLCLTSLSAWPVAIVIAILVQTTVERPLFTNHGLSQLLLVIMAAKTQLLVTKASRKLTRRNSLQVVSKNSISKKTAMRNTWLAAFPVRN